MKTFTRILTRVEEAMFGNRAVKAELTRRFVQAFPNNVIVQPESDTDNTITSIAFKLPNGSQFTLVALDHSIRVLEATPVG